MAPSRAFSSGAVMAKLLHPRGVPRPLATGIRPSGLHSTTDPTGGPSRRGFLPLDPVSPSAPTATGNPQGNATLRRRPGPALLAGALAASLAGSAAFAVLASLNPVLSQSAIATVALSLLFGCALFGVLNPLRGDLLDPSRVVSGLFILCYGISPLVGQRLEWYFQHPVPTLLAKGSTAALAAYLLFQFGYTVAARSPRSTPQPQREPRVQAFLRSWGLGLFAVGLLSFIVLYLRAGGIERIIGGDETRVAFARGFGYLLHASYFMIAGGALYLSATLTSGSRRVLVHALPLVLAGLLFVLLQSRSRTLIALEVGLIVVHYRRQPLRVGRVAIYGVVALAGFLFVGFARRPAVRPLLLAAPLAVLKVGFSEMTTFAESVFGTSTNRLLQAMMGFDAFPDRIPHMWGKTFLAFANPIVRLFGLDNLQVINLGNLFFRLAHPELPSWLETGSHPSALGELLANFPLPVVLLGFILLGAVIRWLYIALSQKRRASATAVALYAVLVVRLCDMVVVGIGQLIFEMMVLGLPLLPAFWMERASQPRRRGWSPATAGTGGRAPLGRELS